MALGHFKLSRPDRWITICIFRKPTPARAPALVGSGIGRLLLMCVIILALAASASNGKIAFKSGRNNTIGIRVKNPDGTVLIGVL